MTDIENKVADLVKNSLKDNLEANSSNWPFKNPDDYRAKTGKRFRVSIDQKNRGLSREESFREKMELLVSK
jgi:hypothetical protein